MSRVPVLAEQTFKGQQGRSCDSCIIWGIKLTSQIQQSANSLPDPEVDWRILACSRLHKGLEWKDAVHTPNIHNAVNLTVKAHKVYHVQAGGLMGQGLEKDGPCASLNSSYLKLLHSIMEVDKTQNEETSKGGSVPHAIRDVVFELNKNAMLRISNKQKTLKTSRAYNLDNFFMIHD
jgi:hypothetical protein